MIRRKKRKLTVQSVYIVRFRSADQKPSLISYSFIFPGNGVVTAHHQIITQLAVAAGSAANQLTVDLTDAEEIAVAHEGQYMEQIMLFGKFCIGTLGKVISGSMVFLIVGFRNSDESIRVLFCVSPVPPSGKLEYLVNQPHIKAPVQIKELSQLCERLHKKILNKMGFPCICNTSITSKKTFFKIYYKIPTISHTIFAFASFSWEGNY